MMSSVSVTMTLLLISMAAIMTAVRGNNLVDFLHLHPLRHHRYHFDVTSDAEVQDLKGALNNFTIDYSFKVIGEPRYFFVIQSDDTEALSHLTFPAGSSVTQFPVERLAEYTQMFGMDPAQFNLTYHGKLPTDKVITYTDWTLDLPENICWETFKMEFKSFVASLPDMVELLRPVEHPVIATYPLRILAFVDVEENLKQHGLRSWVKMFGGDGASKINVFRIIHV